MITTELIIRKCRLCGDKTVDHIISGCCKLGQKEYKTWKPGKEVLINERKKENLQFFGFRGLGESKRLINTWTLPENWKSCGTWGSR